MHGVRRYLERPVRAGLEPVLVCAWVDPGVDQRHPVLPDACIDIVWNGTQLRVAGPATGPAQVLGRATYVGVRFQPGAAPGALGVAASELLDRSVPLRDLWGRSADDLAERLAAAPANASRLLEEAVMVRWDSAATPDPLIPRIFQELSRQVLSRQELSRQELSRQELSRQELSRPDVGARVIERLAGQLGVSERTLRRHCETAIGYGPKTLHRVLRFRHGLRLIRARVPLVTAAQVAGYVDQAHLAYEFQRLAGATPGQMSRGENVVLSSNGWSATGAAVAPPLPRQ
jgi:AraC-like DNA-binding protein